MGIAIAMQLSLIALLCVSMGFAALSYYLGFVKPDRLFAWRPQAAFVCLIVLLIPVLSISLWLQATATLRLAETGITPHPKLGASIGITTGLGNEPIWMFRTTANEEEIAEFYRNRQHRQDWEIINDSPIFLILGKDRQRMTVGTHSGRQSIVVTYSLSEDSSN